MTAEQRWAGLVNQLAATGTEEDQMLLTRAEVNADDTALEQGFAEHTEKWYEAVLDGYEFIKANPF